MFILDSLLVGGLRFVLEKVADVADREVNDPERWRGLLLEAQLAHENGEITTDELALREREILARLRELNPGTSGMVLSTDELAGIDVVADLGDAPGEE